MTASDGHVTSLANGVGVLRALSDAPAGLSVTEIATRVGITRAGARRLALTFQELGYVVADGAVVRLRPRVMELGDLYLDGLGLPALAREHLEALCARVRDTCSLTVLDGDSVVYVHRVKASRLMTVSIAVGTRLPAYRVSSGRAMLATLPEPEREQWIADVRAQAEAEGRDDVPVDLEELIETARRQGYALVDREFNETLRSIAAPVRDADGRALAAVNVSTAVSRTSTQQLRELILPELLDATRAIDVAIAERRQAECTPAGA